MDNLFGITKEEIEGFTPAPEGKSAEEQAIIDILFQATNNMTSMLKDEAWIAKARIVARLPGLSTQIKIAAILMGPASILSQLFLLHLPAQKSLTPKEGLQAFYMYAEMLDMASGDVAEWVALYFNLGFLVQQGEVSSSLDIRLGPLAGLLSLEAYPRLQTMSNSMLLLKDKLAQDMDLEFIEDQSLKIVSIESLAPDN